ncbi:MAG TPA: cytochrome c biogenesis protein CcdA [Candidatus Paceibacterota bacterium]
MDSLSFAFLISAFFAGIVTFFAPCTFPLVPAYLSFIAGSGKTKSHIFLNGVLYVIGFSSVFILLGTLFGLGGSFLFQYKEILVKLGGVLVIALGLYMAGSALGLPFFRFLETDRRFRLAGKLTPGKPISSLLFGASFALGWSPCVGPILGVILTLAASSATIGQGTFLLFVFSLGLAIPFLLTALAVGWASEHFAKIAKYLNWVSVIGGIFLVTLGLMMLMNSYIFWIGLVYRFFAVFGINYEEALLDLL